MKKVIIAGSRNFNNYELLRSELDKLFNEDYLELSFYKENKTLCLNHKISDENKIKELVEVIN